MKKMIYYFSGTGNSLYVAKKIQEQIKDAKLTRITLRTKNTIKSIDADVLGFVFPVYAWGPPKLVEEFIKTAQIRKPQYLFTVATHGGGPGNTLKYTAKLFKKKGLELNGAFDIMMPANYIIGMNPPTQEEARSILQQQHEKFSLLLKGIAGQQTIQPDNSGMFKTTFIHPLFLMGAKKQGKKFSTSGKCTGCGICEKLCPVENIRLNAAKKPEWGSACEACQSCICLCPSQAIESGMKTVGRNRYRHPEISLKEMMSKVM